MSISELLTAEYAFIEFIIPSRLQILPLAVFAKNSIIFASIILAISVIEIYLMMRSSFLSRIKEVGILRAIGVKRSDIKRMFLGEIFAITTVSSMPRNYFNDIYFETNCENKICK